MNRRVYFYVFDTMADFETAYLAAELNSGRFFRKGAEKLSVVTVANRKDYVLTMGGFKILADITIDQMELKDGDALILPGGETWEENIHEAILEKAKECIDRNIILGAICGATVGLGKKGWLDFRSHTSNDLEFLKMMCPDYKGEEFYKTEKAVTDDNLITASGTSALEFSFQVLKKLDVFSDAALDAWYKFYKTGKAEYFYALMNV